MTNICKKLGSFQMASVAVMLATVGCGASGPSRELADARSAYARIQVGPANASIPAEVHDAKKALDVAEQTKNRDDAYVAQRKAQLVESHAAILMATAQRDQATKDLQSRRISRGERAERDLGVARSDLAQERQGRLEAETKTKEAMDNLARMAALKQEARGTVITLSGAVLFVSNESSLLPAAMVSLTDVATALKTTPDRNILVEGHTDSRGAHAYNMDLSQRRADSVRLYLISQGVPQDMIRAQGIGPDRTVADNLTAEGRANNRRVEIVISPAENK